MYSNTESFVAYCDSMMIATEGVKEGFQKMKAWIIAQLNKILNGAEKLLRSATFKIVDVANKKTGESGEKVENVKASKLKASLLALITRCKAYLSKSKALNEQNPDLAQKMKHDVEGIQSEYLSIIKELNISDEEYHKLAKNLVDKTGIDGFSTHGSTNRTLFQKGNIYKDNKYIGYTNK